MGGPAGPLVGSRHRAVPGGCLNVLRLRSIPALADVRRIFKNANYGGSSGKGLNEFDKATRAYRISPGSRFLRRKHCLNQSVSRGRDLSGQRMQYAAWVVPCSRLQTSPWE